VRNRNTFVLLRVGALVLVSVATVLFFVQLVRYSRLRTDYPPGMTIAGVPVGGTDPQIASERLIEVYTKTPVELRYGGAVIDMDPAMAGFDLNMDAMLAAADLARTGGSFWLGFWDFLWNREPSVPNIPLVATIDEARLRTYLSAEISSRYDEPAIPAHPIAGSTRFEPGTPGQELDVARAVALIGNALESPANRTVTLTSQDTAPPRPTLANLQVQIQQVIEQSGFGGIVGLYLTDLQTGETIHFIYRAGTFYPADPDLAFTAASTIKIPVMIETYAQFGPTLDADTDRLVKEMITKSENPATDDLMQKLDKVSGPLMVTDMLKSLGYKDTFIAGYFYDGAPLLQVIHTPANSRTDLSANPDIYNQTTPSESAELLQDIYECAETGTGALIAAFPGKVTREACQEMMADLKANKIGALIEAGVPDGTQVAHKHGWISGPDGVIKNISDVAIVYTPGGNYALTIFAYDPVQAVWEPVSQMFADISETVYNYFNLQQ
jgi:beta-lactamase class A